MGIWSSRLGSEQRGHVGGGQRDLAGVYTGCVEERGSDGRWTNRVRGLGAAAKAFVVARDLYDFDLGHFLHRQNFVAVPIRAGYFSLVESNFFFEGFTKAHDDSALHATVKLSGVNDLAAVGANRELCHADRSCLCRAVSPASNKSPSTASRSSRSTVELQPRPLTK